ncbi:unnamed protein product [Lepidochelys olivacea]
MGAMARGGHPGAGVSGLLPPPAAPQALPPGPPPPCLAASRPAPLRAGQGPPAGLSQRRRLRSGIPAAGSCGSGAEHAQCAGAAGAAARPSANAERQRRGSAPRAQGGQDEEP